MSAERRYDMNILEYIDFLMNEYGMNEEEAGRIADMEYNPEYNADDYDL